MKATPYFKGYNATRIKQGCILDDVICENIHRQALEVVKPEVPIYNTYKIFRKKHKYYLKPSQINFLSKVQRKGFVFFSGNNIHMKVRRLQAMGYMLRYFKLKQMGINRTFKIKTPHHIVFFSGKEKEVYDEILRRYPNIRGVPHMIKNVVVPIFRNLHQIQTQQHCRKLIHDNKMQNSAFKSVAVIGYV